MGLIVENVGSIGREVSNICNYYGKSDATSVVVAKGIIKGSYKFELLDEESMPYKRGNVASRRAEAVMIENALRETASLVTEVSVRDLSKRMLSNEQLEEILKEFGHEGDWHSLILRPLAIYLNQHRPDTRSGLVTFGERVIYSRPSRPDSRNPSTYIIPSDVDFSKLESHNVLPTVKKLYREFGKIRDIVHDLQS
jgi:hypothetical protein